LVSSRHSIVSLPEHGNRDGGLANVHADIVLVIHKGAPFAKVGDRLCFGNKALKTSLPLTPPPYLPAAAGEVPIAGIAHPITIRTANF
jgi:hypothetical protein